MKYQFPAEGLFLTFVLLIIALSVADEGGGVNAVSPAL